MANRVNRSRVHRSNFAGPVRESLWFSGSYAIDDIDTSGVVEITFLNAAALALRPFTVVRTRGVLFMTSDQTANSEDQQLGYAQAVVSDQAAAIGITALPTPVTDSGSDLFFVYEALQSRVLVSSAIAIYMASSVGIERIIDSKAMRKVEDGQTVVSVAEAASTSEGTRLYSFFRSLIKLH